MTLKALKSTLIILLVFSAQLTFAQKQEIQNAATAIDHKDYEGALKSINKALANDATKSDPKAWSYKGEIMLDIFNSPSASDKGLVVDPLDEAFKAYSQARALDEKGRYSDQIINGFAQIFNDNVQAANTAMSSLQYALAYKKYTRIVQAAKILNTYSEWKSKVNTDTIQYQQAYSAFKAERFDVAKNIFAHLVDSTKYKTPELFIFKSQSELGLNDTTAALATLQKGKALYPDNNGMLISELNIFLFTNRFAEAIDRLNVAIAKSPKEPELYNALGNAYDRMVNDTAARTKAMKAYQAAINIKPDYFSANYSMGAEYYNQAVVLTKVMNKLGTSDAEQKKYDALKKQIDGLFMTAIPYFEKAYSINNKDLETLRALKEIYVRTNQNDKAAKIKKEIDDLGGK